MVVAMVDGSAGMEDLCWAGLQVGHVPGLRWAAAGSMAVWG